MRKTQAPQTEESDSTERHTTNTTDNIQSFLIKCWKLTHANRMIYRDTQSETDNLTGLTTNPHWTWGSEAIKWQVTIPEDKCLYTSKDSEYVQLPFWVIIDKAQYVYYLFDRRKLLFSWYSDYLYFIKRKVYSYYLIGSCFDDITHVALLSHVQATWHCKLGKECSNLHFTP